MRRIWAWLIGVFTVVVLGVALLVLLPSLLGFHRYVIESGSMEPALSVGTVVYAKPALAEDLRVGHIISYQPPPETRVDDVVTHRIARIERLAEPGREPRLVFTTKGDANQTPDPWRATLDDDEAAREEFHIPYVGYIYLALAVPWVRLVAIVIPAFLIAVLTGIALWRAAGQEAEEEGARIEREKREREERAAEKEPV